MVKNLKQESAKRFIIDSIYIMEGTFINLDGSEYGYTFQFNSTPEDMKEAFENAIGNNKIKDYEIMNNCWQKTLEKFKPYCRSRKNVQLIYCTTKEAIDYFLNTFKETIMEL